MFSVHDFVRQEDSTKQVPFVSSMMSHCSKHDYTVISCGIMDILPSPPQVQLVVLEYKAIWRTMRIVTPNIKV